MRVLKKNLNVFETHVWIMCLKLMPVLEFSRLMDSCCRWSYVREEKKEEEPKIARVPSDLIFVSIMSQIRVLGLKMTSISFESIRLNVASMGLNSSGLNMSPIGLISIGMNVTYMTLYLLAFFFFFYLLYMKIGEQPQIIMMVYVACRRDEHWMD